MIKQEKTVVAATANKNKLREFREILKEWNIVSSAEAGFLGEVEEMGATFAENAELKARAVMQATGLPALADDSGLCVECLNGAPGVYSARYAHAVGGHGDADNRALLLENMQGQLNRRAYFVCCIAMCFPDGTLVQSEGRTYGSILREERGENGFGYDSLFFSDDLNKSFGEASDGEKNAVSHRGRALRALGEKL